MYKLISSFMSKKKDGGSSSPVDAYFVIEMKGWFSVAFLKFNKGSREEYHTHAFNAYTWFIKGFLVEEDVGGDLYVYGKSIKPKLTKKSKNHRVKAIEDSWCFTLRGPWDDYWTEYNDTKDETTTFTHSRNVVSIIKGLK